MWENNSPDTNPFTLWNAHKAFIRGILIQIGSRIKKQRNAHLNKLISDIQTLETQNKTTPLAFLASSLSKLRTELRVLLCE